MTFEEFESFVKKEPGIGETMNRAAAGAMKAKEGTRDAFGPVAIAAGMGGDNFEF